MKRLILASLLFSGCAARKPPAVNPFYFMSEPAESNVICQTSTDSWIEGGSLCHVDPKARVPIQFKPFGPYGSQK